MAMYNCMVWYLPRFTPQLFKKASVSDNVNGDKGNFRVMRLCRPPLLRTTFCIIQEAAEPQRIIATFGLLAAQVFQKFSNAAKKLDFGVCIQGNSSKKITTFFLRSLFFNKAANSSKAKNQLVGITKGILLFN